MTPTATQTPQPGESCPEGTPTRIPTPNYTPAGGCTSTPPDGVLTVTLSTTGGVVTATITNNSTTCSYPVGLAVYRKYDENIDNQELFNYRLTVVGPGSTVTLAVTPPPCKYQADVFFGSLLQSFANNVRYGSRLLQAVHAGSADYCTLRCVTPVPTWTSTPTRTATSTATRTSTATATATVSSTKTATPLPSTNTPTKTSTPLPTNTKTSTPTATRTPQPDESCPEGTPTRIPTPNYTPAGGCTSTPPDGVLTVTLSTTGGVVTATITNNSTTCSYPVGLAVYRKYDENIDNQELFNYRLTVVGPGSTVTLAVTPPPCKYQADVFFGSLLQSFANNVRYGSRLLQAVHAGSADYCTLRCVTPVPTWTSTPTRTATSTVTRTATSTATATASSTKTATPIPPTGTPTKTATPLPSTKTPTKTPTKTTTPVPTNTRTSTPTATRTPQSGESCPVGTPTRIPTPRYTPAGGCTSTPPDGVLSGTLNTTGGVVTATITNTSSKCSYPVGLAAYRKYDENIDNQELFVYRLTVVGPGKTVTLSVTPPSCKYQADAFYGSLLLSFANNTRYGTRLLQAVHAGSADYCTLRCVTPVPTWTNIPSKTATPTPTATATKTSAPAQPATPTRTPVRTFTPSFTPTPTPKQCAGVDETTCTDDGNQITLVGGAGDFDGTNTRFTFEVCGAPDECRVRRYKSLSHFTLDLGGLESCGGFTIVRWKTTSGYETNDPTCSLTGGNGAEVKWDFSLSAGECQTVKLVLAGRVGTGPMLAATKSGHSCDTTTVLGPSCDDCGGTQ
ncbi:MAG: hypothetical protein ABI629_03435 [bacterium]